jgi:hypothetical protein
MHRIETRLVKKFILKKFLGCKNEKEMKFTVALQIDRNCNSSMLKRHLINAKNMLKSYAMLKREKEKNIILKTALT